MTHNRSILNKLLVKNEYHCITGSFRLKILNFRILPWKKISIIYLRDHLTVSRSGGFSLPISLKSSALRTISLRADLDVRALGFFESSPELLREHRGRPLKFWTQTDKKTERNWVFRTKTDQKGFCLGPNWSITGVFGQFGSKSPNYGPFWSFRAKLINHGRFWSVESKLPNHGLF